MTFLDKLKEDYPNLTEDEIMRRVRHSCPYVYGYGGENVNSKCMNDGRVGSHCVECWNREMPNTEPKTEKPIYKEIDEDIALMDARKEAYNQGLNDAWELLRKLSGLKSDEFIKIYDTCILYEVIYKNTPQEALAKLKVYEDSKIKVGDVVAWTDFADDTFNGVVLDFKDNTDNEVVVFNENGGVDVWKIAECKKTGKHIDIQSILEQIGGE